MTNDKEVKKEAPVVATPAAGKKKKKKFIPHGRAYIQATYNNTIVTITDPTGNVVTWSSAGRCGFKGPKKATPYAASVIVKEVAEKAKTMGLRSVDVFVKGVGSGREGAIRALNANNINVQSIKDITPIPHNGCRPRKVRRV
jgi:small subunit ribosomal protein S11